MSAPSGTPSPQPTRWFKGNLHAHSFWSDGHGFAEMIADWFKAHGYHFLSLTEHDRLQTGEKWVSCDPAEPLGQGRSVVEYDLIERCRQRFGRDWVELRTRNGADEVRLKRREEYALFLEEPGRFILVSGEEITGQWGPARTDSSWINAYHLAEAIAPRPRAASSAEAISAVLAEADALRQRTGRPLLVSLNHPNWHWNASVDELRRVPGLRFMEIHTALNTCRSEGDADHLPVARMWDILLADRRQRGLPPIYGLASDDCHAYDPDHHLLGNWALPGRAWVMVRASELSAEALIAAMEAGDFYSSSGVILGQLESGGDGIRLSVDAEPGVGYAIRFIGARGRDGPAGTLLESAAGPQAWYECRGDELYVRAEIVSDRPHPNPSFAGQVQMAWTQPVFPGAWQAGIHRS